MCNAIRSLYRTEKNAVGESCIHPFVLLAFILFIQLMHPYLFRDSATNITSPRQPPLINSLRKCGNIRLFGAFKICKKSKLYPQKIVWKKITMFVKKFTLKNVELYADKIQCKLLKKSPAHHREHKILY
jgi:hypothetical protein